MKLTVNWALPNRKSRLAIRQSPKKRINCGVMTFAQSPSTKQDILDFLVRRQHATAQVLAEAFQVSPQAIRRHLKELEEEGLLDHQVVQTGMGRPIHAYALSPKGRDHLPERYGDFAVSLLHTMAETVGKEQVNQILRAQWHQKALEYQRQVGQGSLSERLAKLINIRKAEGYMSEWQSIEPEEPDDHAPQFIVTEYNCAISEIAETFPNVCGHELEMFQVALQDCTVKRTHWIVNGEHRCGYLVRAR